MYPDLFRTFNHSYYNSVLKIVFISASAYTLYLMKNEYRPTHDPNIDTFKSRYLLAGAAALAIIFPYKYTLAELLWTFSIWLESVAILPQLFMVQRTGEAETITTHYIFALGIYRALYIPNWLWRYFVDGYTDPIAVLAGLVQTALYCDFFYIYWTKSVSPCVTPHPGYTHHHASLITIRYHERKLMHIMWNRVMKGKKFELPV